MADTISFILGPLLEVDASHLRSAAAKSVKKASQRKVLEDAHKEVRLTAPALPTVEDVRQARKIARKIPRQIYRHLKSRQKGKKLTVLEVGAAERSRLYSGAYVPPPQSLDFHRTRGYLRALILLCDAAGLKPRATMIDAESGTGIVLEITIPT